MLNPANDMFPPPSSPTNSSGSSSSDLDTESTGSFFHDRSTTLGTLMGVTCTAITFRAPSQSHDTHSTVTLPSSTITTNRNIKNKNKNRRSTVELRRRKWWRLCSDSGAKPASLGEFLEVERRFGDAAEELEGVMVAPPPRNGVNGRILFENGRVLPPANGDADDSESTAGILCSRRFPVLFTGICCGGVG